MQNHSEGKGLKIFKPFFCCALLITFSLLTACGFKSEPVYSSIINSNGYVQPISTEPAVFEKFAIESNGEIQIKGQLVTEGPLADIFSNEKINISSRSIL